VRELTRCRSCYRPVWFVLTEKNKLMPLDPDPQAKGPAVGPVGQANVLIRGGRAHVVRADEAWEGELYASHFSSCPDARRWGEQTRKAADAAIARIREGLK
jgi:hypothetical protein